MRRTLIIALLALLIAGTGSAQKTFTLEDLFRNPDLYPGGYSALKWIGTSPEFSYQENNALMAGNAGKDDDRILVSLEKLNKALGDAGGKIQKRFPSVNWISSETFSCFAGDALFTYNISEGKAKKIAGFLEEAGMFDVAPTTLNTAYTIGNNLFVAVGAENRQLSFEPDTGVITGTDRVHRNEWGIDKGTFWSPSGRKLAFYRMDESRVTNYPLVDISETPAVVVNTRYPMAGMTSHLVTVGVYDVDRKTTIFLQTGEPAEQFLTNVTWTPDEKYILIAVLNRAQDHMWMRMYDAQSGALVRTLFEETDKEYVEPLHGPLFLHTLPNQFIWQSPRDGFNHLYLYDLDGKMIRQLTSGPWMVTNLLGIGTDDKLAWFTGTKESPICRDLYTVELKTGKIRRLTEEAGWHDILMSPDMNRYIDDFSSTTMATLVTMHTGDGKQLKELLRDENPLKDYKMGSTSVLTLKSDLGDDLYCRLIKPADFDSTKRYPVIIYVYGGPHNQLVTNTWLAGAGMFLNYMANQGYVVFGMDNHGTAGRGQEFEQVIHRQAGTQEVKDQMVGVDYLRSLPYVDRNRIAVHGWSYGGFMTLSMLLKHPKDFKVGVAGGPVCDWKYYEVMYGERYMDTPQENGTGYEQAAPSSYADQLKADLLIIHGSMDPTVVQQNSLEFVQKCIKSGIQLDYFIYPGHEHNVSGIDRLHLYKKIEKYIVTHL